MLNNIFKSAKTSDDDDSSGSGDFVLLAAEEDSSNEEATTDQTVTPGPEPTESLLEEASDLLLEQFVDEPDSEPTVTEAPKEVDAKPQEKPEPVGVDANDEEKSLLSDDALAEAEQDGEAKQEEDIAEKPEQFHDDVGRTDDTRSDDDTKSAQAMDAAEKKDEREAENPTEEREKGEDEASAEADKEEEEDSKENAEPQKPNESEADGAVNTKDFRFGTRGEVNGAAVVFGVAALLIAGPIAGVIGAVVSAHVAANKPCKCADATRHFGGVLDNVGKKKRSERAAKRIREGGVRVPKPHIWDKITDRLVEGGECLEKKFVPRRRRLVSKKVAADE